MVQEAIYSLPVFTILQPAVGVMRLWLYASIKHACHDLVWVFLYFGCPCLIIPPVSLFSLMYCLSFWFPVCFPHSPVINHLQLPSAIYSPLNLSCFAGLSIFISWSAVIITCVCPLVNCTLILSHSDTSSVRVPVLPHFPSLVRVQSSGLLDTCLCCRFVFWFAFVFSYILVLRSGFLFYLPKCLTCSCVFIYSLLSNKCLHKVPEDLCPIIKFSPDFSSVDEKYMWSHDL